MYVPIVYIQVQPTLKSLFFICNTQVQLTLQPANVDFDGEDSYVSQSAAGPARTGRAGVGGGDLRLLDASQVCVGSEWCDGVVCAICECHKSHSLHQMVRLVVAGGVVCVICECVCTQWCGWWWR